MTSYTIQAPGLVLGRTSLFACCPPRYVPRVLLVGGIGDVITVTAENTEGITVLSTIDNVANNPAAEWPRVQSVGKSVWVSLGKNVIYGQHTEIVYPAPGALAPIPFHDHCDDFVIIEVPLAPDPDKVALGIELLGNHTHRMIVS